MLQYTNVLYYWTATRPYSYSCIQSVYTAVHDSMVYTQLYALQLYGFTFSAVHSTVLCTGEPRALACELYAVRRVARAINQAKLD